MSALSKNPVIRTLRPAPGARTRLVGVPYAGGGATIFQPWRTQLPAEVELCAVQLPGRQDRLREPGLTSVPVIVELLRTALAALPPLPTVFYGHSFGAILSFEVARRMQAERTPLAAIIVGAHRAPKLPLRRAPAHALPTPALLEFVHRHYGTARLVDPDLIDLAVPPLRSDFTAFETYQFVPGPTLDAPITVLQGTRDTSIPREDWPGWSDVASGPVSFHEIDAGHFFMDTHASWVLDRVRATLSAVAPAAR